MSISIQASEAAGFEGEEHLLQKLVHNAVSVDNGDGDVVEGIVIDARLDWVDTEELYVLVLDLFPDTLNEELAWTVELSDDAIVTYL